MAPVFECLVAFRYLRARRREGFVSVIAGFSLLGIALGVATLIIVMAVMNGFRHELLGRILGLEGHVSISAFGERLSDSPSFIDRVQRLDQVKSVAPVVEGQVMVSVNGRARGGIVRGLSVQAIQDRSELSGKIIAGRIDFARDELVIGARMARFFGIDVGGSLTLIAPQGTVTAFGTVPRIKAYRVGAIFDVGMYEYDSSFIYMPLSTAQSYFRAVGQADRIDIMSESPDNLQDLVTRIWHVVGEDYHVVDWTQAKASLFNALQVERNVMFLILTLIIVVAAFNVISGLVMLVKDKSRDIAILRTMGAARGSIVSIFFLVGASVGVCGTLLGFLLGVLFCENIEFVRQVLQAVTGTDLFSAEVYFLSKIPAEMNWLETAGIVGMSLLLSLVATIYPSWKAAKIDPVEALRYE